MIPEPHPSVVDGLLFGAPCLAPACKKLAALSVRTHSSQDVARDVVPSQVQPPQGSVAGETVHQGPAPQETDVIPAQVWKKTCCHSVGWEVLAQPRMLPLCFTACGCQHGQEQRERVRLKTIQHLTGVRQNSGDLTQLLESGVSLQGQGQFLCPLVTDLVVPEVQLPQGAVGC